MEVLYPDLANDERHAQHFEQKARVFEKLKHPGLVPILQHGRLTDPANLPYVQMKYVEGLTLREALDQRKKFLPPTVMYVMTQLAEALNYMHQGTHTADRRPGSRRG